MIEKKTPRNYLSLVSPISKPEDLLRPLPGPIYLPIITSESYDMRALSYSDNVTFKQQFQTHPTM